MPNLRAIHFPAACAAFALALGYATLSAASAQRFLTYVNDRFGTTAEVPSTWKADPPPDNGDGLIFRSPDGHASITVSGILHVSDTVEEAMRDYEQPGRGEQITYLRRGKRWLVVSGIRGDTIFYSKHLLSCRDQIWNNLRIDYPAREKASYDKLVARIARSLRAGPSEQIPDCSKP